MYPPSPRFSWLGFVSGHLWPHHGHEWLPVAFFLLALGLVCARPPVRTCTTVFWAAWYFTAFSMTMAILLAFSTVAGFAGPDVMAIQSYFGITAIAFRSCLASTLCLLLGSRRSPCLVQWPSSWTLLGLGIGMSNVLLVALWFGYFTWR